MIFYLGAVLTLWVRARVWRHLRDCNGVSAGYLEYMLWRRHWWWQSAREWGRIAPWTWLLCLRAPLLLLLIPRARCHLHMLRVVRQGRFMISKHYRLWRGNRVLLRHEELLILRLVARLLCIRLHLLHRVRIQRSWIKTWDKLSLLMPLLPQLCLKHHFFHLLDWNCTLYIYPLSLDHMLLFEFQDQVDATNVSESHETKPSRFMCTLI